MTPTLEEEERKKEDLRPMYYYLLWIIGWFGGSFNGSGKVLGYIFGFIISVGGYALLMLNDKIKSFFGIK